MLWHYMAPVGSRDYILLSWLQKFVDLECGICFYFPLRTPSNVRCQLNLCKNIHPWGFFFIWQSLCLGFKISDKLCQKTNLTHQKQGAEGTPILQISIEPNLMSVHVNMEVNKNYSFNHCTLHYLWIPAKINTFLHLQSSHILG